MSTTLKFWYHLFRSTEVYTKEGTKACVMKLMWRATTIPCDWLFVTKQLEQELHLDVSAAQ